jgi:polyphosphate kinase
MGSADWMPRNLDRRVELVFPVEDEDIKKRVQEVITVSFKDTVNARQQLSTGVYKSVDKRGKHKMNCQKFFSKLALKAQKQAMKKTYASTVGTPIVPVEVKKEDSEQ